MKKIQKFPIIILVFGLLLRLINLNQSFWLDEAAQVIESARPFWEQFDLAADFHPPLFHLILHFWMYLGKTEVWVRIPSVLFGVGSLILLYKLGVSCHPEFISGSHGIPDQVRNDRMTLLASLFLAISPYHIWYSQEARPYMLFVFLSLLSTLMLIKKRWILYILTIILCLYSLYFALFLILGHVAYIIFIGKKYYRQYFLSLFISLLTFIPWLPFFLRQLEVGTTGSFSGWKDVVSVTPLKAIALTFAKFILGKTSLDSLFIYGGVLTPVLLLFCWSVWKMREKREDKTILLFFFIPFIFSILTSFFIPVVAPQRLLFLLPFFYLILARGINNLQKNLRLISVILVCSISLYGVFDYYTNPYIQRENWRGAVLYVENDAHRGDIALFVFPEPFAPFLWYNKGILEVRGIASEFILRDRDLSDLLSIVLDKKRVYLFQYLTGLTDPEDKAHLFLQSNQFKNTSTKDFPGVGFLYVYEK